MSTTSWSKAFKEIYGKTPQKDDFTLAPEDVRVEYNANRPLVQAKSKGNMAKRCLGLKRPPDLVVSPIKRMRKRPRTDSTEEEPRVVKKSILSERKLENTTESQCSPKKQVSFGSLQRLIVASTKSPSRATKSPRKVDRSSFRSLFDTPEKGEESLWSSMSTMASCSASCAAVLRTPRTPTRTPQKPTSSKKMGILNTAAMLMPTPEKIEMVVENFEDELPTTSSKAEDGDFVAKAFDPKTGKEIKRVLKRSAPRAPSKKKADTNFVRINLRKKTFVRGKMSAEQKRKMLKKKKWKARQGGR